MTRTPSPAEMDATPEPYTWRTPVTHPADRPATEPRTHAGRALHRGEIFDLSSEEDRRRLALAIESEAAQGAAPLGVVGAVLKEMDINEATLGTPVIYRSDLLAILEGAAPSEGAAPRAGHDITDPNAPLGWQCGDPACPVHGLQEAAPRAETNVGGDWLDIEFRAAPRAEGLDVGSHAYIFDCGNCGGRSAALIPCDVSLDVQTLARAFDEHPGPVRASDNIAHDRGHHGDECWQQVLARLSRPSDERVPESEEPR